MGVPKFFRYISERYPCLSELIRENQIPEFDNLYLDMNGIIHSCSHPNDSDIYFRITEEQIFKDIFHYIDTLFRMIQPKKLFFMAIDGVAPRAKMNQQRGRRFRSAKEAEMQELKAKNKGEKLPSEERFDSNCITPGTPFMARLQEGLKYFVKMKISTNHLWQNCRVILSGHETPGEGEHKIMEYIRYLKAQENYDRNTRHCLYGLDADLIMLGLCTHELYFSLLREEVKFGRQTKRAPSVNETRFFLLHLGLLREYLELEFSDVKDKLSFDYNIERIIDDWIFMGFLVGNDFIPHLPNLHIASNALPLLYAAYMEVLPTLDGYINECGKLNLGRLEVFIHRLAIVDKELFTQLGADFKYLDSKHELTAFNFDEDVKLDEGIVKKARDLGLEEFMMQDEFIDDMDDEEIIIEQEFVTHKRNYYINKMHYREMTPEVLVEQTQTYIRALQWTLSYYYHGVQSWSWYYPYHYAPYISDVMNFRNFKIDFDLGKPFLPFEQLLAVLPAASKNHLPIPYRRLMTDVHSKVIDYYPVDFETDLNGKKQDWEAVVLIPFIDEVLLLNAMKPCNKELLPEERSRNIHGPMLQYDYTDTSQGSLVGKFNCPDIGHVMCTEKKVTRDDIFIPEEKLILELSTPTDLKYHLGFPTLKHLLYSSSVSRSRVKVFEQSSRNDNMVINIIIYDEYKDVNLIAEELLDKEIFVSWPHLRIAKVCKISNENTIWTLNETTENNPKKFESFSKAIVEHHMGRLGIDVGEITVIVHVNALIGQHYVFEDKGIMKLKKTWDTVELVYPIQAIVKHIDYFKKVDQSDKQVEQVFAPGTCVFMLSTPYYGSKGEVIDPTPVKTCGRIKVCLTVYPDPDYTIVRNIHQTSKLKYVNSYSAASMIGISTNILSRITGSILIIAGARRSVSSDTPKSNIGLQLKFTKNNEEVVGFTRKHGGVWYYSPSAIELVKHFADQFPELFRALGNSEYSSNDMFFEFELFPKNLEENNIDKIIKWLKTQPHYTAERRTSGTEVVEKETVLEIIQAIDDLRNTPVKSVKLQVKPHLLYKPGLQISEKAPDSAATYSMFDRVVVARELHSIPIGFKGTIIGIHHIKDPNPVRQENLKSFDICFDVIFDQEFDEGTAIYGVAEKRICRLPKNALINISYGSDKIYVGKQPITVPPETNAWSKPLTIHRDQQKPSPKEGNGRAINVTNNEKLNKKENIQRMKYEDRAIKKATEASTKKVETWFKNSMIDTNNEQDANKTGNYYKYFPQNQNQISQTFNLKKNGKIPIDEKLNNLDSKNINDNKNAVPQQTRILDHKTFALRQMLGVSAGNKVQDDTTAVVNSPTKLIPKQEQHTVLSVDDFFNMHKNSPNKPPVMNLPQPPQNWRKEVFIDVSKLENRSQETKQEITVTTKKCNDRHPPGQPTVNIKQNITVGTTSQPSQKSSQQQQNVMHHPQPKLNYVPSEFSPGLFDPKTDSKQEFTPNIQFASGSVSVIGGPQNLSNNSMNPAGHGAFIPLQAVKNLNKAKPGVQNPIPQPPSRFIQRNAEQRQEVQQKQTESNENFASFMKDDNPAPIPIRKNIPKPFRPSRIAAKFSDALAD